MKKILILILLLQPLSVSQQFTFSQIFKVNEILLNERHEWNGSIMLNTSGEFLVIITIYYKLDQEWYWTDVELELNGKGILLHLDGRNHVITRNKTMELPSEIKVKLTIKGLLVSGVIYGNSSIKLTKIKKQNSISNNTNPVLGIVAVVITIVPILIQLVRRRRAQTTL